MENTRVSDENSNRMSIDERRYPILCDVDSLRMVRDGKSTRSSFKISQEAGRRVTILTYYGRIGKLETKRLE